MVRINLLPIRDILRKRELKQSIITLLAALVATFLVGLGTYMYFSMQVDDLEAQKRNQTRTLGDLKKKNKEISDLKTEIARLQKQVDTIQKLTRTRDTPAPFMSALSFAIPDEVWIKSIAKTGKSFSLDGTGIDNTVVVNFVERLQKIRQGFSEERLWMDRKNPKEQSFFRDVKLVQIVAATQKTGLASVNFKIVGHLR